MLTLSTRVFSSLFSRRSEFKWNIGCDNLRVPTSFCSFFFLNRPYIPSWMYRVRLLILFHFIFYWTPSWLYLTAGKPNQFLNAMTPRFQRIQVLIMAFKVYRLGLKFSSLFISEKIWFPWLLHRTSVPESALLNTTQF